MSKVTDSAYHIAVQAAAEEIVKAMIEREVWRTTWRVEVEDCVFKFEIKGYAKSGTPRRIAYEAGRAKLYEKNPW